VPLENKQSLKGLVCLLVINKIEVLPEIAVRSILSACSEEILIGYRNYSDVEIFDNQERITLLDLSEAFLELGIHDQNEEYSSWSDDLFFQIVQLKWTLLEKAFEKNVGVVVYSDLDVVWVNNAFEKFSENFQTRTSIDFMIQSFTRISSEPQLCMGFVGMRNNQNLRDFIQTAKTRHATELKTNPRIGDDDIVTLLNRELGFPSWILELPQTTFPVGVSVNLFAKRSIFPGLNAQKPFIFHANYVVGLRNKILLLKVFLGRDLRKKYKAQYSFAEILILSAKKLKWNFFSRIRG
jgi:hypothetical protein